jgi:hypothetical protein
VPYEHVENADTPAGVNVAQKRATALDPLENSIGHFDPFPPPRLNGRYPFR